MIHGDNWRPVEPGDPFSKKGPKAPKPSDKISSVVKKTEIGKQEAKELHKTLSSIHSKAQAQTEAVASHTLHTQEGQRHSLTSLFSLTVVPDAPNRAMRLHGRRFLPSEIKAVLQACNIEKKELIAANMPLSLTSQVASQARKYPIVQALVDSIKKNIEKWDDLALRGDKQGIDELASEIALQCKNLAAFSDIIANLCADVANERALLCMTGKESKRSFETMFSPFREGRRDLTTEQSKQYIQKALEDYLRELQADLPLPASSPELAQMRKDSPVTTKAIQFQAELHTAIRRGKAWAARQPELIAQGTSANQVFKLGGAAFFKVGSGGEEAAGAMEKLMWNMAVIMGQEERFVATGKAEVRDAVGPMSGGIQVAQRGMTLEDYMAHPSKRTATLQKSEIMKGTLASMLFGMYDAHRGNVFVTDEGRVKFFDNTRSMPHSNGFINRGEDNVVSSLRCSLLCLPEAREPFTQEEKAELKLELATQKEKIANLRQYMNSPQAQAIVSQLPPGWLDVQAALDAMEERVVLMTDALESANVNSLQDLAVQANPSYKFAFAMTYLSSLIKPNSKLINAVRSTVFRQIHNSIGYLQTDKEIHVCAANGYDVAELKRYCDDPSTSLDQIITKARLLYRRGPQEPDLASAQGVWGDLLRGAAIDLKDCDRQTCSELIAFENETRFNEAGVQSVALDAATTMEDVQIFMEDANQDIGLVHDTSNDSYSVVVKTSSGFHVKPLNLTSAIGKIEIGENVQDIDAFIKSLRASPPKKSLPPLPAQER